MGKWFGDRINDGPPTAFLLARGYTFGRDGFIKKPVSAHKISEYEGECISFLCDEWDYGFRL